MSTSVITVENLSKRYIIGHQVRREAGPHHILLGEAVGRLVRNAARKALDLAHGRQIVQGDMTEEFWALKDVSFEVQKGEVLGIIGRNGAGKSTLLKILSRITEPTAGRVTLRGRVASLLEVGTGFHPELSGSENIYLNGAILGMSRAEIRRKFDEIVAFAEIDKFIDTPVKRYSSGMYVRLAFAVAAHLEPEILIVDEVLAVGDADFQKKCLGKMEEVSRREGRTVLFVSHNLRAISELASRALLLDKGIVTVDGPVSKAVSAYIAARPERQIYESAHREPNDSPHIARAEIVTSGPDGLQHFSQPFEIKVWVRHTRPMVNGCLGVHLVGQSETSTTALFAYPPHHVFGRDAGTTLVKFHIPALRANVGQFHLRMHLTELPPTGTVYEIIDDICGFEVVRPGFFSWWGSEICAYHEDFSVHVDEEKACARPNDEICTVESVVTS